MKWDILLVITVTSGPDLTEAWAVFYEMFITLAFNAGFQYYEIYENRYIYTEKLWWICNNIEYM